MCGHALMLGDNNGNALAFQVIPKMSNGVKGKAMQETQDPHQRNNFFIDFALFMGSIAMSKMEVLEA